MFGHFADQVDSRLDRLFFLSKNIRFNNQNIQSKSQFDKLIVNFLPSHIVFSPPTSQAIPVVATSTCGRGIPGRGCTREGKQNHNPIQCQT